MFKNLIKSSVLAVAALALMTSAAFAADGDTSVTISGGSISITSAVAEDFTPATIGVDPDTTAGLGAFSVTDARANGAGWHVMAVATTFTNAGATHTLAAGSLEMSEPDVTPAVGTTSEPPSIVSGPYTIDNGAVKIASAALDEGMGTYDFDATTLTLALPLNVYADTYFSTVTISQVTAP